MWPLSGGKRNGQYGVISMTLAAAGSNEAWRKQRNNGIKLSNGVSGND